MAMRVALVAVVGLAKVESPTIEAGGKLQELTVDRVISAVGIVGNVENLGLEGTKVVVERSHIEIEQGAVGRHHAVGLGPWRQGIERALLQRLHHFGTRGELSREICFRQSARGTQIPK